MDLLNLSGISKQEANKFILKDISFKLEELQNVAIAGETGAGKSTLLKIIAGLLQPTAGEVLFEAQRVRGPEEKLVPGHPGIAYLSQQFELPQFLRVEQVLSYANTLSAHEAGDLYALCRIEHLLSRKTDQLSGGERQRIAIARLLSSAPKLLLLDEPFSNLDMVHKSMLKSVIDDIGEHLRITCMLVSHDPLDSLSWADKILVLKEGQLVQLGSPRQVYRQPANEYVAGLFGRYNLLSGEQAKAGGTLFPAAPEGKKLLIRPEALKLGAEAQAGTEGRVSKVRFFGSYYEIEIQMPGFGLKAETPIQSFTKGDTVSLSVSPGDVWYI